MTVQFDERQLRWLVEVVGAKPIESLGVTVTTEWVPQDGQTRLDQREAWLAQDAKKEQRLQAVRSKLDENKSKIRALMELEVTLTNGQKVKAFSGSQLWNPDEEFDAVHHIHQSAAESLSLAEMERLRVGCEALANLRNKLTGSIGPQDWPKVYEQHITQGRSAEDVADEWLVSADTIERVVEQYAAMLQKSTTTADDPAFLSLLGEQKPVQDDEPLFSDLEIRRELFDPLVREKIIPDNEVDDRFNQTYQVFTGASDEYKTALRGFSDEATEDPELTQLRERTTKGIKSVVKIGSDLVGILGQLSDAKEVTDVAKLAGDILKITEQVGLLAVTSIDMYYGKEVEGVVDQVGAALEAALKATLGRDAAEYAKWVRAGFTSVVNAREIGEALMKREQGWVDSALEKLAAGVENALSIGGNESAARVGKGLKHAFMLKVNGSKIYEYLQQDPPAIELVLATIGKAATAAFKDVVGDPLVSGQSSDTPTDDSETSPSDLSEDQVKEREEQQKEAEDEFNEALDEITGALDEGFGEVITAIEEARKPLLDLQQTLASPEKLRELTDQLQADSTKRLVADIESELRASPTEKHPDDDETIEMEFVAIEPLIADVKRAGVYLKLADSLLDAGMKAVGEFVSVVKVASAGKDLLKNMIVSYGKKRQLYQWKMLRQNALAAASITSSSFAAKIKDLDFEYSETRYKALLSLAETLGTSLTTIIDPSGIAGNVISKSASASGALLDIVLEGRKAGDLSRAWEAYREALRNPGDRIKLRDAIQKNSTLAKYALAYAALHDGDPLAKAGLAEVGLTEEVLRDPSAKVSDVVTYLEAKWSSDPSNMKKVYRPADWQADTTGDLTLAAWMANLRAARGEKLGADKVVKGDSGAIEGALLAYEQARDAVTLAATQAEQSASGFATIADEMNAAMDIYRPALALCAGIKTELLDVKKLAKRAHDELTVKKKESGWSVPAERAEVLKDHLAQLATPTIAKVFTDILERVREYGLAADQCTGLTSTFLLRSEEHLKALRKLPAVQQTLLDTLSALKKALRQFSPERADGKVSQVVLLYVRSVMEKADEALNEAQASHTQFTKEISQLEAQRQEIELLPAAIKSKRGELDTLQQQTELFQKQYREHIVARKKEWDEARLAAGI